MERLLPSPAAEATPPPQAGSGLRTTAYLLVALMLAGAAWVRFNAQIVQVVPALAGPAADIANRLADESRIKGLIELAMVPAATVAEALPAMALPPPQQRQLGEAIARRRLKLVRMPLVDLSATAADAGRAVRVSAGGYTRIVQLGRQPVVVTLPIGPAGSVSFETESADGVSIGAISLSGLIRLPDLAAGQGMDVGIIAQ